MGFLQIIQNILLPQLMLSQGRKLPGISTIMIFLMVLSSISEQEIYAFPTFSTRYMKSLWKIPSFQIKKKNLLLGLTWHANSISMITNSEQMRPWWSGMGYPQLLNFSFRPEIFSDSSFHTWLKSLASMWVTEWTRSVITRTHCAITVDSIKIW